MGRIYVFMGKSATGKDTIFKRILSNSNINLKTIVTYTTRPIREGENNGCEYHFVNDEKLNELKNDNKIVELRAYNTVYGVWNYFTVDDGQIDLDKNSYAVIGTIESFVQIRKYYGEDKVIPIYIEVEDGERLSRALGREKEQTQPKYSEMCRRFLADCNDFSEEKIMEAGIVERFVNNNIDECVESIVINIHNRTKH